ncbi:hypothetical protein BDZ90DRAFT_260611 [Jaminaea rosea]|uniref:Mediator of RNA polymerase II transcription subunit 5 n=1 Tax=Jaminaea rosea TaxID=1569628 RepID=A0A316URE4_9BASI|nr:hypothetical protein BDZ90DRAFT_260611 [Jaminaea rosea]PWN27544.1 hypothetical protein BDZ90DRAFT_260611 [Jaminaea rosea]
MTTSGNAHSEEDGPRFLNSFRPKVEHLVGNAIQLQVPVQRTMELLRDLIEREVNAAPVSSVSPNPHQVARMYAAIVILAFTLNYALLPWSASLLSYAITDPNGLVPFPYFIAALAAFNNVEGPDEASARDDPVLADAIVSRAVEKGSSLTYSQLEEAWDLLESMDYTRKRDKTDLKQEIKPMMRRLRTRSKGAGVLLQMMERLFPDQEQEQGSSSSTTSAQVQPSAPQSLPTPSAHQLAIQHAAEAAIIVHYLGSATVPWQQKVSLASHFLNVRLFATFSSSEDQHARTHAAFYTNLLDAACASSSWLQVRCALLPCLFAELEGERTSKHDAGEASSAPSSPAPVFTALETLSQRHATLCAPIARACQILQLFDESQAAKLLRPSEEQEQERPATLFTSLRSEAQSHGQSTESLLSQQLQDATSTRSIISSLSTANDPADYPLALPLSQALPTILQNASTSSLPTLARLCGALLDSPQALQLLLLFVTPTQLLDPLHPLVEDDEALLRLQGSGGAGQGGSGAEGEDEEEESAMVGRVLLFVQTLQGIQRNGGGSFSLGSGPIPPDPSANDPVLLSRWIRELFDSDGVSDELIKDSPPRILLSSSLVPTLFSQAIHAAQLGMIDEETLKSGLSVFLQDILSFALPSGLRWLIRELAASLTLDEEGAGSGAGTSAHAGRRSVLLIATLEVLVLDDSCPPAALRLAEGEWRSVGRRLDAHVSRPVRGGDEPNFRARVDMLSNKFKTVAGENASSHNEGEDRLALSSDLLALLSLSGSSSEGNLDIFEADRQTVQPLLDFRLAQAQTTEDQGQGRMMGLTALRLREILSPLLDFLYTSSSSSSATKELVCAASYAHWHSTLTLAKLAEQERGGAGTDPSNANLPSLNLDLDILIERCVLLPLNLQPSEADVASSLDNHELAARWSLAGRLMGHFLFERPRGLAAIADEQEGGRNRGQGLADMLVLLAHRTHAQLRAAKEGTGREKQAQRAQTDVDARELIEALLRGMRGVLPPGRSEAEAEAGPTDLSVSDRQEVWAAIRSFERQLTDAQKVLSEEVRRANRMIGQGV